ncbi:MAG: serine hydrolase [Candidatus Omnitrophica bacterium]|nr:serine hydrolase [Candidatus Omnitrophota bacterium]
MRSNPFKRTILITFTLIIVLVITYYGYNSYKQGVEWARLKEAVYQETEKFGLTPYIVIKDLKRGWHIDINEDIKVPSASIVKVPIMACCFYAASKGRISLDDQLSLSSKDKVGGSGILKNKRSGTKIPVSELIELMIARSDNTAANMLINLLGFDYLNEQFKRIGLKDTNLSRLMMDMGSRDNGIENYTSAKDMALVFEKIYKRRLFSKGISLKCLEMLKKVKSKDRIPAKLPKKTTIAHKTGLEKSVCHDVGIVFTENGDFLICALTSHKNRNSWPSKLFISKVARLTYEHFQE